ncbi:hypothetical protein ACFC1R_38245 [Kitasatospora sp. NPDC056138]|uniref:hypothetical protein n=1 Tax=Kitasatospora sp. NPDC056138 TaxID=3345724 RepID=UPI0035DDEB02
MENFETVADRLYALAPARFTAARNAAADQARQGGDRALAGRIGRLRRPTQGAWLANLLTRTHPEETGELLGLGRALRDAQSRLDGERMRELTVRRHRAVAELVAAAAAAASAGGHQPGPAALAELEHTLLAATSSPSAADALAGGRLSGTLETTAPTDVLAGLALADLPSPRQLRDAPATAGQTDRTAHTTGEARRKKAGTGQEDGRQQEDRLSQRRETAERAERDISLAQQTLHRLERELQRLAADREKACKRADHAAGTFRRAQAEANLAAQEQQDAERAYAAKRAERDDAARILQEAGQAAERARRRVEELAAAAARAKGGR